MKLGAGRERLKCVWWHLKCAEGWDFSSFWTWCVVAQGDFPRKGSGDGRGAASAESSADRPFTGSLGATLQIWESLAQVHGQQSLALVCWRWGTLVLCLELEHVEESEVAFSRSTVSACVAH